MQFVLPQEARNHFDKEADSLIAALRPLQWPRPPSPPRRGSDAYLPIAQTLTEKDLRGRPQVTTTDWLGQLKGIEVHGDVLGQRIHESLPPNDAERLSRLTDSVARHRALHNQCGGNFVTNHLVDWITRRRLREPADSSWTADLLSALASAVEEQTILVPLEGIRIAEAFDLGPVTFDFFTETSIDQMVPLEAVPHVPPEVVEDFRSSMKKKFQGKVYARVKCIGEEKHAQDLAIRQTDAVLGILKMFDAAALDIRARCVLGRMGQVLPGERHLFRAGVPERLLISESVELGGVVAFGVGGELLDLIRGSGIGKAAELLGKEQLTDLEKYVLEAISHFAHGIASPAPQDRLVHALVAVESLLLRDQNEPIQAKLGQRMAMLTAPDLASRKEAIKQLHEGYALRSAFVHHGVAPGEVKVANGALMLCWNAVNTAALNTERFNSKQHLLDSIDDALLS